MHLAGSPENVSRLLQAEGLVALGEGYTSLLIEEGLVLTGGHYFAILGSPSDLPYILELSKEEYEARKKSLANIIKPIEIDFDEHGTCRATAYVVAYHTVCRRSARLTRTGEFSYKDEIVMDLCSGELAGGLGGSEDTPPNESGK